MKPSTIDAVVAFAGEWVGDAADNRKEIAKPKVVVFHGTSRLTWECENYPHAIEMADRVAADINRAGKPSEPEGEDH